MIAMHESLALAGFEWIGLDQLQVEAAFLTRTDRKYLVPEDRLNAFLGDLDPEARVLTIAGKQCFSYRSPYFDDAYRTAYFGGLRRRPNRFKVRTRLYRDSGFCQLEVKVCGGRGETIKHRTEHDPAQLLALTTSERDWLNSFPQIRQIAPGLDHCLTTTYLRSTLVLPEGSGRVTIDRDVVFSDPDGRCVPIRGLAIVETKGAGRPISADIVLWRMGFRPVTMSKFAVGMSLLEPQLPANRWHRVRGLLASSIGAEIQEGVST